MSRKETLEQFGCCWEGLEDPHRGNAALHDFHELLMMALCCVLCGGQGAVDMAVFAEAKEPFLRSFLTLVNGLPSHDTFSRLFRNLDPDQFRDSFQGFMAQFSEQLQGVVAIDGKVLRRSFDHASGKSALHMVSAWGSEQRLVLAQIATDAKSNEITAVPRLLTTEFSFKRDDGRAVGVLQKLATRYASQGRPQYHTSCGILMHSSLAATRDGLPLGLAAIKFWNRDKFHGANALKRRINPTRVPIEKKESIRWLENLRQSTELLNDPSRCVHIGDRESDLYELFCLARQLGTHFLVRTCVDRLAGDGGHTVRDVMRTAPVSGLHRVQVRNKRGEPSTAVLEIRYHRMVVRPPIGKQKEYSELVLNALHAQERDTPKGRDKIDWKLLTDLPVQSRKEAAEKLDWYAQRWKIETTRS